MPTVEQIADAIDQRLAEAGRQLASLQAARAALVQTSSSRGTDGAARTAAPRSRARRSANSSSDTRQGGRTGSRNGRRKNQAAASPEVAASGSSASPASTRGAGAAERGGRRRSRTQPQSSAAGATTAPARRSAPRPQRNGDRAATGAPQSSRRRARDLEPARIEELLRASTDGLSLAALAKELGVGAAKVRTQLNELHRTGKVRSEGSRRTSRWRLVTDEERIAARVAELERAQTSSNSSD